MHVYVHIPFCHRICPYCSFYKHTPASTDMKKFVDALLIEAQTRLGAKEQLRSTSNTLYFGGGTPSMLSTTHLTRLVKGLYDALPGIALDEFSFESNPATFTERKAANWKELGITRVSLGAQSWDPHILQLLGREHTPEDITQSFNLLRRNGIREINIDLMFSIPGQSLDSWRDTLEKTISLQPDHISAYNLSYEEDTAFFQRLQEGSMSQDPNADADYFELAHSMLTLAGFRHYETSNYAQDNRISRHNMAYWTGEDYIGLGPGAVSTLNGIRIHNTKNTQEYIETVFNNGLPGSNMERLSENDLLTERIAIMLRTDTGVPLSLIPAAKLAAVEALVAEELAAPPHGDCLILTDRGRMLCDEIALELIPD